MTFSNEEADDNKKRNRPRISGSKAGGGNGRNKAKPRPPTNPPAYTNGTDSASMLGEAAEEITPPVAPVPEIANPVPTPARPPEPKYNPNDGTLELPDIDLKLNIQFPNTDFGAGQGPGTVDEPRILSCGAISCAYASDVGRQRYNNEDSAVAFLGMVERIDTPFGFFAIADGMGGHENGEVASNIAVRKMMDGVMRDFYLPTKEGRPLGVAGETPVEIMSSLINDANQSIVTESISKFRTSMGTTLSCIVISGQFGFVGHVGDSRIYVVEKETSQLNQITTDHSLVQRLVEAGQLTAEEAIDHPQRSYLYMSLGQRGVVQPDTQILSLGDLSHILLCSDGLWDMVDDATISQIINTNPDPGKACQELINAANNAGGADNVTVMIVKL